MTDIKKRSNDDPAGSASRQGSSGTGKTLAAEVIATDLGSQSSGTDVAIETITLQHEGFEAGEADAQLSRKGRTAE